MREGREVSSIVEGRKHEVVRAESWRRWKANRVGLGWLGKVKKYIERAKVRAGYNLKDNERKGPGW